MKPAWSWQFDDRVLKPIEPIPLPAPITREWAWGGATGAGVKVGIVDSGVQADHPDVGGVAGGVVVEFDPKVDKQPCLTEGPHEDVFGHGTACAGVIRSLAPEAELFSIRVLGSGLTGREEAFAAGLGWAIEHEMDVVNLSLGTGARKFFSVFHQIADLAYFRNVALVAAIANVNGPCYPAEYASVISVAAHDDRDPTRFFFNPRPPVEFGAPGIDIDVAWVGGGRMRVTGNSFAAPHIAAYVALIRSKHPDLRPFQIKTVLHSLADNRMPV